MLQINYSIWIFKIFAKLTIFFYKSILYKSFFFSKNRKIKITFKSHLRFLENCTIFAKLFI